MNQTTCLTRSKPVTLVNTGKNYVGSNTLKILVKNERPRYSMRFYEIIIEQIM